MATIDGGRIGIGAQVLGVAQRALDETVRHSTGREAFGHPIAEFHGLQWRLGDMVTPHRGGAAVVYRVAPACRTAGRPACPSCTRARRTNSARTPRPRPSAGTATYASTRWKNCAGREDHRDLRAHERDPAPADLAPRPPVMTEREKAARARPDLDRSRGPGSREVRRLPSDERARAAALAGRSTRCTTGCRRSVLTAGWMAMLTTPQRSWPRGRSWRLAIAGSPPFARSQVFTRASR